MKPAIEVLSTPDVALRFAGALEDELDDDVLLTVGGAVESVARVVADEPVKVVSVTWTAGDGTDGVVAFVALGPFAERLENAASDELLMTACGPALGAATQAIGALLANGMEVERPHEVDLQTIEEAQVDRAAVVFPILEGTAPVAFLAFLIAVGRESTAPVLDARPAAQRVPDAASIESGVPLILADVEMGVTAELGRCRMSMREILSMRSGAVIDLDRPVGAPIDVVVNGTLIARGEVVVIDEEFAVRITEILTSGSSSR